MEKTSLLPYEDMRILEIERKNVVTNRAYIQIYPQPQALGFWNPFDRNLQMLFRPSKQKLSENFDPNRPEEMPVLNDEASDQAETLGYAFSIQYIAI